VSNKIFFDAANITMEALNSRCEGTMNTALGIHYTAIGDDYLECVMPVNENTIQPLRMLNGGASLALIESLGSMAANLAIDRAKFVALGQAVTCSHIRPAKFGDMVTGRATALHLGKSSHVWEVSIRDGQGKLVCKGNITMAVVSTDKLGG
jgi:uncharacterized protein (TIGR00369 family)